MAGQPVVLFCEICGTGINLVKGDAIFKCVKCGTSPVCAKCYNAQHQCCRDCANEIDEKQRQKNVAISNKAGIGVIRGFPKWVSYVKGFDGKTCVVCKKKPGFIFGEVFYKCDNCSAVLCATCRKGEKVKEIIRDFTVQGLKEVGLTESQSYGWRDDGFERMSTYLDETHCCAKECIGKMKRL